MYSLYLLAHAGVEHTSQAEAASHETSNTLTVVLVGTALAVITLGIVVKLLAKPRKETTKKINETSQE